MSFILIYIFGSNQSYVPRNPHIHKAILRKYHIYIYIHTNIHICAYIVANALDKKQWKILDETYIQDLIEAD